MNTSLLVTLLDNVNLVKVKFSSQKGEYSDKSYIYKTAMQLQIGSKVLVECGGYSASYSLAVAEVVELDVQMSAKEDGKFKWVVACLDKSLADHEELLKAERDVVKTILSKEKAIHKEQLRKSLSLDATDVVLLEQKMRI